VYRELKSMIVDRKLKPGDKILQEKIRPEFGVSRTPLMAPSRSWSRKSSSRPFPEGDSTSGVSRRRRSSRPSSCGRSLRGLRPGAAAQVISSAQAEKLRGFFRDADLSDSAQGIKRYADETPLHQYLIELGGFDLLNDILENYNIITVMLRIDVMEGLVRHPRETLPEHEPSSRPSRRQAGNRRKRWPRQTSTAPGLQLLRDMRQEKSAGPQKQLDWRRAPGPAAKKTGVS
jgi:hypothetical protein